MYSSAHFASAVDGGEWSAPWLPGTHLIGVWLGSGDSLDAVANKRKTFLYPCQESNTGRPAHSMVTVMSE